MKDHIYRFYKCSDQPFFYMLPQEGLTVLTRADIEFTPETVELCDVPPQVRMCRGAGSRAPPGPQEDEPVLDFATQGEDHVQFEMMMHALTGEYELFSPPDITNEMAYHRWLVESHNMTSGLMHMILHSLTRIRVPPELLVSVPQLHMRVMMSHFWGTKQWRQAPAAQMQSTMSS